MKCFDLNLKFSQQNYPMDAQFQACGSVLKATVHIDGDAWWHKQVIVYLPWNKTGNHEKLMCQWRKTFAAMLEDLI